MAVFKQELNWSTYQNNQLKVLESIEKSLNTSEEFRKSVKPEERAGLKELIESIPVI